MSYKTIRCSNHCIFTLGCRRFGHPSSTNWCRWLKLPGTFLMVPALQWLREAPTFEKCFALAKA